VIIKIHIAKIASIEEKKRKDDGRDEPSIPYSGFGRV
jgi:hypothetical protein